MWSRRRRANASWDATPASLRRCLWIPTTTRHARTLSLELPLPLCLSTPLLEAAMTHCACAGTVSGPSLESGLGSSDEQAARAIGTA